MFGCCPAKLRLRTPWTRPRPGYSTICTKCQPGIQGGYKCPQSETGSVATSAPQTPPVGGGGQDPGRSRKSSSWSVKAGLIGFQNRSKSLGRLPPSVSLAAWLAFGSYSMLRNNASGSEIGLPGRMSAGFSRESFKIPLPTGRPKAGQRADFETSRL